MKIMKNQLIKIIKEEVEDVGKMYPHGVPRPASDSDYKGNYEDLFRSALQEINGVVQTAIKNKSLGMKPEIGRGAIEKIAMIMSEMFATIKSVSRGGQDEKHRLVDLRKTDPLATWKKS
jgi:hypothetical protein